MSKKGLQWDMVIPHPVTLNDFAARQKSWSIEAFGPLESRGPVGPLLHLAKEAKEVSESLENGTRTEQLEEFADLLFLVLDPLWRSGFTVEELLSAAYSKLEKNKRRRWPDWRTAPKDSPIEHIKPKEDSTQ